MPDERITSQPPTPPPATSEVETPSQGAKRKPHAIIPLLAGGVTFFVANTMLKGVGGTGLPLGEAIAVSFLLALAAALAGVIVESLVAHLLSREWTPTATPGHPPDTTTTPEAGLALGESFPAPRLPTTEEPPPKPSPGAVAEPEASSQFAGDDSLNITPLIVGGLAFAIAVVALKAWEASWGDAVSLGLSLGLCATVVAGLVQQLVAKLLFNFNSRRGVVRAWVARMPKQHRIIWAGVVCLTLMATFVPWKYTFGTNGEEPAGYHFIFLAPDRKQYGGVKTDVVRLIIPMAVVAGITATAAVLTREKTVPPK
jgi:hypothetical protein